MFRRRSCCSSPPALADVTVLSVRVDDRAGPVSSSSADAEWAALRRIVAETVILQDSADQLLAGLRDRPDPADVAAPCGRLKGRFVELREALPFCGEPDVDRY